MDNISFYRAVLPGELVDNFTITSVVNLGDVKTKQEFIEVLLEEKNVLPAGYNVADYESKGFLSTRRVQDFPLRAKAVYLIIKRRRWRHKQTKKEIQSDYSYLAEGSKITKDLSDFLKETSGNARRYFR